MHYVRAGDETLAIKTWSKVGAGAYSPSVRYLHRDHLGSVVAISTETGTVESRSSFDAWGKRRDPNTWVTPAPGTFTAAPTATDRGYTGHENIDELGLVHMNGRIYDPEIGKFLSADPTMQFPESTQGYNRYAYTGNNPLTYTDPSGFSFWKSVMKAMGWIGFIVSLVFPVAMPWWQSMLQSAWQGFLMSGGNLKAGLMAGLTAGLGLGLGKLKLGPLGRIAASGLISAATGGSFGKGALGGLVGMVKNAAISQLLETSGIADSIRGALDAGTSDTHGRTTKHLSVGDATASDATTVAIKPSGTNVTIVRDGVSFVVDSSFADKLSSSLDSMPSSERSRLLGSIEGSSIDVDWNPLLDGTPGRDVATMRLRSQDAKMFIMEIGPQFYGASTGFSALALGHEIVHAIQFLTRPWAETARNSRFMSGASAREIVAYEGQLDEVAAYRWSVRNAASFGLSAAEQGKLAGALNYQIQRLAVCQQRIAC